MSHDGRWRTDAVPPGWWQHPDGRWFPPDDDEVKRGAAAVYRSWPRWAKIAAPVSAAILALAILGAVAGEPQEGDRAIVASSDEAAPPPTTERPQTTSTTVRTTTTTTAPTTTAPPTTAAPTTTAPPTTAPRPPPPPTPPPPPPPPSQSASYANCSEARAAGVTPLYRGDPGYAPDLDRDDDGIACE